VGFSELFLGKQAAFFAYIGGAWTGSSMGLIRDKLSCHDPKKDRGGIVVIVATWQVENSVGAGRS
jgi:hypothetical protein